ncbi:RnfABCDGE type electron transport complex subunit D [Candidatus Daviesbacteria bacterium]|nr:RnfABCDGE type electron transport complex subunit D [Candidatus Daviesbacteria bacterium]
MLSVLSIPKVQLVLILFLLYATAAIKFPNVNTLFLLFVCVGFNVTFDLLFTLIRKRTFFIPLAAMVTGLIMALIIDRSSTWLYIATAAAIAMGIKNFVRVDNRHILNPAASGLFLSGLLFNQYLSWWGVSFQTVTQINLSNIIFFLILLSPAIISFFRFKKYYSILAYIFSSTVISQLLLSNFSLLDPSILFFAIVMLPEPMTSPVNYKKQIIYGALVAVLPFLFAIPLVSNDPLLPSLLLGNLIFLKK